MINRRLVRIKSLQQLYAFFNSPDKNVNRHEEALFKSFEDIDHLYKYLLSFSIGLTDYAQKKIYIEGRKLVPSQINIRSNTKFIENVFVKKLRINNTLKNFLKKENVNYNNDVDILRESYNYLIKSDVYNHYLTNENPSFDEDKKLWCVIFSKLFYNFETLFQYLGDKHLHWNNDVEFIFNLVVRTIKTFTDESDEDHLLLPKFKNNDDQEFARKIFIKTIVNKTKCTQFIKDFLINWQVDRLVLIDVLIINMAITEIIEFPTIPINVSFNEYIEITKQYSTNKSSTFIHGVLDSIVTNIKKEGLITKN